MTRSLTPTPLATLGALCFALACGSGEEDPSAANDTPVVEQPATPTEAPADVHVDHTLEAGQTLWDVSRLYGVPLEAIMEANELTRRESRRLNAGRVLRIPGVSGPAAPASAESASDAGVAELETVDGGVMLPDGGVMLAGYHTLSEGETLWDLANAYDKTVDELLEANGFTDDDVRGMRAGRRILIPGVAPSAIRSAVRPEGRGIWHTVAEGESIWDIARRYRLGASEIMGANALSRDEVSDLRTGRRLFIPGRGPAPGSREPARERPLTGAQRGALARAQLLGLGTSQAGTSCWAAWWSRAGCAPWGATPTASPARCAGP
ncbi:MAG: LysM peptidoglycan-binding domain-containing protein [Sandaracinaceae bacterium]|nr:LysM peptidoglycan-binding domain-containing protein [Sandaracinaceae bacterium]